MCEAFFYLKNFKFSCLEFLLAYLASSVKTSSILMMQESLYQTESFLTAACISLVYEPDKP